MFESSCGEVGKFCMRGCLFYRYDNKSGSQEQVFFWHSKGYVYPSSQGRNAPGETFRNLHLTLLLFLGDSAKLSRELEFHCSTILNHRNKSVRSRGSNPYFKYLGWATVRGGLMSPRKRRTCSWITKGVWVMEWVEGSSPLSTGIQITHGFCSSGWQRVTSCEQYNNRTDTGE